MAASPEKTRPPTQISQWPLTQPLHSPDRLHRDPRMVAGQHVSIGAPLTAEQLRGIAARHWPGARLATKCVIRFIFL